MSQPLPTQIDFEKPSLRGNEWALKQVNERFVMTIAQKFQLPEIIARIIATRDIAIEDIDAFLNPTLKDLMPDPYDLKDMEIATKRLVQAITSGEKFIIFGDYDVDGATSSSLFKRFVEAAGGQTEIYIPDRIDEGYGPSPKAMQQFAKDGIKLVVTLDCGTSAFEAFEAAKEAGLEIIVIDHHAGQEKLPPALAIVNPNRVDEDSNLKHLCAAGMTFLFIVAINRALRENDWYKDKQEPNLMQWLDLVALGTICDVVPLKTLNRAFVHQGLKIMARRQNKGITALTDIAKVSEPPSTYHAGFIIGPRINAGGRIGKASLGAQLLASNDHAQVETISQQLDHYNHERKEIEAQTLEAAFSTIEKEGLAQNPIIMVKGQGWHPGVIGIVASRLKDHYKRPACVISFDPETKLGKASGRSIKGVDLGQAVIAAYQSEFLVAGGGHMMAVGFTVHEEKFDAFNNFMTHRVGKIIDEIGFDTKLSIDAIISPDAINGNLIQNIERIAPFGMGNPQPKFIVNQAYISHYQIVGEHHLKCKITNNNSNRKPINAIAFKAVNTELGKAIIDATHYKTPIHLMGTLKMNHYMGYSTPQLMIEDAMI